MPMRGARGEFGTRGCMAAARAPRIKKRGSPRLNVKIIIRDIF